MYMMYIYTYIIYKKYMPTLYIHNIYLSYHICIRYRIVADVGVEREDVFDRREETPLQRI